MLYSSIAFATLTHTLTHAIAVQGTTQLCLNFSDKEAWQAIYPQNQLPKCQTVVGHRHQTGTVYWELQYAVRNAQDPLGPSVLAKDIPQNGFALNEPIMCPQPQAQYDTRRSHKECLVLSVYVPDRSQSAAHVPDRKVYVLGHPGANAHGDHVLGGIGDPMKFASDQDAVVVTFNHRLGLDGFLIERDSGASDQMQAAFSDQQNAFKWVRHFIEAFGGNPNNVTFVGCSAGASAGIAHMTSGVRYETDSAHDFERRCKAEGYRFYSDADGDRPANSCDKALFDRAWIMSSVDTEHMFMEQDEATNYYHMFGRNYGCYDDNTSDFLQCMTDRFWQNELLEDPGCKDATQDDSNKTKCWSMDFIDSQFGVEAHESLLPIRHVMPYAYAYGSNMYLQQMPIDAFKAGNWWKIPVVFGMMKHEESIFRQYMEDEVNDYWTSVENETDDNTSNNWNELQKLLRYSFTWTSLEATEDAGGETYEDRIMALYSDISDDSREQAAIVMRESLFYCKKFEMIEAIVTDSNHPDVYQYTIEENLGNIGSFHFADYLMMLKAFQDDAVSSSTMTEMFNTWYTLTTVSFTDVWKTALRYMLQLEHANIDALELDAQMVPIGNLLRAEINAFASGGTMGMTRNGSGTFVKNVYNPTGNEGNGGWTPKTDDATSHPDLHDLKVRCDLMKNLEVPKMDDLATTTTTTTVQ